MIIQLFPLWALALSGIALAWPNYFIELKFLIVPLLMAILLFMGLTLSLDNFKRVLTHTQALLVGVALQFIVMPTSALIIATIMGFSTELTIGMLLVGSVAGGTASNLMCYLAKGDVALSITMTSLSTLLGVVLTPLLVTLLAGQDIEIPTSLLLISLLKIVLAPVVLGLVINTFFHKASMALSPSYPYLSMLAIVIIIAIVVALSANKLAEIGGLVLTGVIIHNAIGLSLGYGVGHLLGFSQAIKRTLAYEVGLQNSGLASALAIQFFTPAAALPGTLFSIWHNISGSLLASYWRKETEQQSQD